VDFSATLDKVALLWDDEVIQKAFSQRGAKYSIGDSAKYFFDSLERINKKDFTPSLDDILRARVTTTGIFDVPFEINKFAFRLIDVGGQRNERRKWIHCFEQVTALLYFVSLSEYDEKLREYDTPRHVTRFTV